GALRAGRSAPLEEPKSGTTALEHELTPRREATATADATATRRGRQPRPEPPRQGAGADRGASDVTTTRGAESCSVHDSTSARSRSLMSRRGVAGLVPVSEAQGAWRA